MNKNKRIVLTILMLVSVIAVMAQADRRFIRQGNRQYRSEHYEEAEATYRKAMAANAQNPEALYNLGCALMAQQKDSMAVECFQNSAKIQTDRLRKAQAYHNIGVICQQKKLFSEAADAYKASLKCNPKDDETRYNLALCLKQMKNQPQQNNQQQKKDDKNKDQDKKQDQKQDQNKDQNKDEQKQDDKMSKDNAEQLLNAAMQQEKATQQRMKKAQQQPARNRHQRNW